MARRDNELAAKILVEAMFEPDTKVAKKYGVTLRTLQNYKAALSTDDALSLSFAKHYALLRGHEELAESFDATEAQVKLNHWMLEMEWALSQMVGEVKAYWLELKNEALDFSQKMQVFQAALSFMAQLGEPLTLREVLANGSSDGTAQGQSVPQSTEGRTEATGTNLKN